MPLLLTLRACSCSLDCRNQLLIVPYGRRGWAGITVDTFLALNPLLALQCDAETGGIGLQEGSVACIGDTIAYCSNVYTATSTDTCRSITKTEVRGACLKVPLMVHSTAFSSPERKRGPCHTCYESHSTKRDAQSLTSRGPL
jgi:hypothetical protein